jgi:hypothetical protein
MYFKGSNRSSRISLENVLGDLTAAYIQLIRHFKTESIVKY